MLVPKRAVRTLALLLPLGALPACVASCDVEPFANLPIAAIGAPDVPSDGNFIAACVPLIRYEEVDYVPSGATWRFPTGTVQEVGEASGANKAAGTIDDRRVYRVEGVDPADAIAMNLGRAGAAVLLVRQFGETPSEACHFLPVPAEVAACAGNDG